MPFYIFKTENLPEYPPKSANSPNLFHNQKEISFNLSESFFQIPASFDVAAEELETLTVEPSKKTEEPIEQSSVFCIPETQYTPLEKEELLVNVTADQSIILPSISSVLEASARSAINNHRRNLGIFPVPIHQRVADKLDMPSQNPNSPLLYGSKASESMDLTEDSLLLALNSSVILFDEKYNSEAKYGENTLPSNKNNPKFSLDFLNTPPLNPTQNAANKVAADFSNADRISTQVLLQNLDEDDTQMSVDHDISLLSLDDREKSKNFDPLDLLPNTPSEPVKDKILEENEEGHDAIFFPDSFDETNNPFLVTERNEHVEQTTISETIDENMNSRAISPVEAADNSKPKQSSGNLSNFEARLLSSMSTSPGVNPQEFGLKRIVLSARKTGGSKPTPISIKPTSSSGSIGSLAMSRSVSNESVPIPEPVRKSLGARAKRVQFNKAPGGAISKIVSTVTPSKPAAAESSNQEEKFLSHIMRSGNKRINMIIAEPRKTPIAGIKTSMLSTSSPVLRSKLNSIQGTPTKSNANAANKSTLVKEASLASYYVDLVMSSPCPQTPVKETQESKHPKLSSNFDSPMPATVSFDSACNLNFAENQWIFFRSNNSFLVGSVVARTSKTRDIWRVKQSNGNEFTVSSLDMCPVAFLRPFDEIYLRTKKVDQVHTSGPYKFKRFSPQNSIMIELHRESPQQLYDCLKLTRVLIEKEVFARIRDRFDRGCIEDSQIRDQIMTLNRQEPVPVSEPASSVAASKRKKRIINSLADSQASQTPKKSRQQQIFMDIKFLITVGDNKEDAALKEKYTRLIESHGGELLTNLPTDHEVPVLKTFLLSNGFKRTPKFMTAIIRGVPRVHFNWLEACCNQGCYLDPTSFTQFLIEPPSGCKPSGLLFKGKKFYFSGSTKFKNSWVSVIRLLGGTVSNSASSNTIVLVEDPSKSEKGPMEKIVNVDWLIRCVVEKTFL